MSKNFAIFSFHVMPRMLTSMLYSVGRYTVKMVFTIECERMKSMINMNLNSLRKRHKLTQEQLAEELNVSRQVIAKWEKGESTPDLHHSMNIANFFGVTIDALVNHNPEEMGIDIPPKGQHFFGTATVGERGQIVIPKKAREIFQINPGDSIIIIGDEERGLALAPEKMIKQFLNMVKNHQKEEE